MARKSLEVETVGEAYLALLAERGVEYFFANAGTDFAPIIEAFARAEQSGLPVPKPILGAHENTALSMAHGYAMVSGKVPAVMVHVSVGTANGVCAVMNASRENVPILFTAGRSPLNEDRLPGARDAFIHWGQEMYDQAGMVRELVKWDYELRNGEQLETVVDRALAIAKSEPAGPVYLALPREVIAAPLGRIDYDQPGRRVAATPAQADPAALNEAARILAKAEAPLIVTTGAGRDTGAMAVLSDFAQRFAIPVVQYRARHLAIASDHPMNLGYDSMPYIAGADAILAIECDVPWIPSRGEPGPKCRVIHLGLDPLFQRYPIRGFRCDLAITGQTLTALRSLDEALVRHADGAVVTARRHRVAERHAELRAAWRQTAETTRTARPIHPAWVSHCLDQVKGEDAIVVSEYTLVPEQCRFTKPGTFFGSSSASGLGWGMGAALGAKLAAPDRLVVATLGDGSYMFANPVTAHYAARLHDLPILVIVVNNAMWNAVQRATFGMYPGGRAAHSNRPPLIHLDELPAFEQVCAAAGGYGERVEDPAALPGALERAIHAVTRERRQALLNVICQAPPGAL